MTKESYIKKIINEKGNENIISENERISSHFMPVCDDTKSNSVTNIINTHPHTHTHCQWSKMTVDYFSHETIELTYILLALTCRREKNKTNH